MSSVWRALYCARERNVRHTEFWGENMKERDRLEGVGAEEMRIMEFMLKK
jgi:hypothetical protein